MIRSTVLSALVTLGASAPSHAAPAAPVRNVVIVHGDFTDGWSCHAVHVSRPGNVASLIAEAAAKAPSR